MSPPSPTRPQHEPDRPAPRVMSNDAPTALSNGRREGANHEVIVKVPGTVVASACLVLTSFEKG